MPGERECLFHYHSGFWIASLSHLAQTLLPALPATPGPVPQRKPNGISGAAKLVTEREV